MARLFDDGVPHNIQIGSAIVSGAPLSMACWLNGNDATANQTAISLVDIDSEDDHFRLLALGSGSGNTLRAETLSTAGGAGEALTTNTWGANAWHHLCGVFAATNARSAFIDGTGKGTNATDTTPLALDAVTIGSHRNGGGTSLSTSGRIAEAALWDIALTDAEVAVLAEGYSPLLVHPQNLVFYAPLIRELLDVVGGVTLTNNATTVGDHCRVFYPAPLPAVVAPAVAVATRRYSLPLVGVG